MSHGHEDVRRRAARHVVRQVPVLRGDPGGDGVPLSPEGVQHRQWQQKRLAHAATDIVAQVATLSRVTGVFEDQGVEASGQERYIAETFCTRAHRRVERQLDQVDENDDERMHSIARIAHNRGG